MAAPRLEVPCLAENRSTGNQFEATLTFVAFPWEDNVQVSLSTKYAHLMSEYKSLEYFTPTLRFEIGLKTIRGRWRVILKQTEIDTFNVWRDSVLLGL